MPEYLYRCRSCSGDVALHQKITEAPLAQCGQCGGPVFRVVQPVGICFVGSGFYTNDHRPRFPAGRESSPKG